MDIFLLPSKHEGLGIVLIEAQANGLPCYTSKDVVPLEAKVTELLHYISLEETPSKWAEQIDSTYMQDVHRSEWNEIVRKSQFDIFNSAKKLEEILTFLND